MTFVPEPHTAIDLNIINFFCLDEEIRRCIFVRRNRSVTFSFFSEFGFRFIFQLNMEHVEYILILAVTFVISFILVILFWRYLHRNAVEN